MSKTPFLCISEISSPWNAQIHYFKTCGSTMDEARKQIKKGEYVYDGELFLTEFQTRGRGRQGRSWFSEPGENILMTLILHTALFKKSGKKMLLPLIAGAALAHACVRVLPEKKRDIKVKWPNDLMINHRKSAGILCEISSDFVIVGCGINVNQQTFDNSLTATSIRVENGGKTVSREEILQLFIEKFHQLLSEEINVYTLTKQILWKKDESVQFRIGTPDSTEIVEGIVDGIGSNGGLILQNPVNGELKEHLSGEILY